MSTPNSQFQGFYPPEYTMVPNDLFVLMASLSGAELKVLLYVMRQTFGWHRDAAAISLTELQSGTGLTRKTLAVAVRSLEARDCMTAHRSVGADGVAAITVYRLNVIEREGRGITTPRQRNNSSGGSGTIPHLPIEERNRVKESNYAQVEETAAALWAAALEQLRGRGILASNVDGLKELPVTIEGATLVIDGPADLAQQWTDYLTVMLGRPVRFTST